MWIAKINIGLRRFVIFIAIAILTATLINVYMPFIAYMIVGGALGISGMMMYFLYSFGMFLRKYQFRNYNMLKEVRDYVNFRNPKENYRCIYYSESQNAKYYDSSIFLKTYEKWSHFDILRVILTSLATPPKKILILGAGGGAFLYSITRLFPEIHIDAVEVSSEMIRVAENYFLANTDQSHIRWIRQDALSYLRKCNTLGLTYDCIIVDLAKGSSLPRWIYKRPFASLLNKTSHQRSLIFINYIHMNHQLFQSIAIYQSIFRNFKIYHYNKNIIGTNYILPESIPNITFVA